MALFSDDIDFYLGAATTWLLSACVAIEILCAWILGHRLRSKLFHVLVLVYGMRLGRHALKLRTFLVNVPASRRSRCPAPVVGVPSAGECILMEGAYVRHLLQVATSSFHLMVLIVGLIISKKQRPRRPRIPGWGGIETTVIEILFFVLCILTCAFSVPRLVADYVAATANRASSPMAALLSDDADFYFGVAVTWLLSACVAVEILWGWIRGHRLRSKFFHALVLVYGLQFSEHALKLRTFLANIPVSRLLRCPAPVAGALSAGECILMEGAYVHDLLQAATSSFHLMTVIIALIICKKERPWRPRVPGLAGVGTTFIEILLFVLCILTCACTVPDLVSDYVAATANRVLDRNT